MLSHNTLQLQHLKRPYCAFWAFLYCVVSVFVHVNGLQRLKSRQYACQIRGTKYKYEPEKEQNGLPIPYSPCPYAPCHGVTFRVP